MRELSIPHPAPFHFRDVVFSHGWFHLPPYTWDADGETLSRCDLLPGGPARWHLQGTPDGLLLRTDAPADALPQMEALARRILALDEDFAPFHALCAEDPGLHPARERGKGRILRCPTAWEDLVKTLFSVNTTWRQTVAMTRNLVERYGERHADGVQAFPTPEAVARVAPEELQQECRVGYRAASLSGIARGLTEGTLDLETLRHTPLPTPEVEQRLRALHGIGPYAAANMLMLLGHYDHLPVDSWFRKTLRETWFAGREATEREMVAAFERFRPFRTLVYYFYDWDGARGLTPVTTGGE